MTGWVYHNLLPFHFIFLYKKFHDLQTLNVLLECLDLLQNFHAKIFI